MVVLPAHVEQAALVGIRHGCIGKVKRPLDRRHERRAVELQRVERPRLDQRLHTALVELAAVDAHAEIKQAGEIAAHLSCGHYRLNRLLPRALDGPQAIADDFVRDRLKAVAAPIDVGCLKRNRHLHRIFKEHPQLVRVVHLHRHVGREELGREMHLEPGRVVRQQRIGS